MISNKTSNQDALYDAYKSIYLRESAVAIPGSTKVEDMELADGQEGIEKLKKLKQFNETNLTVF